MATGRGAGLRIAGYTDVVEVGRGGFAVVHRARRVAFGQDVAIKVLDRAHVDAHGVERLARERQVLGLLAQHPNVVTVYDAGTTPDGEQYLVMEFLPGGTLADRLERQGPPGVREVVDIAVRLCGALATAHRAGVLHRDIKPDNVLVSRFGEPVLADFGLARMRGGMRTRTGIVTATVAHAPPEVLDGREPTARSDLYSLASTVFTLLTGTPPFSRDGDIGIAALLARVDRDPVPDLRPRGVPAEVCALLERAMAKDPRQRPESAAEFGRGLQHAQRMCGWATTDMVVEDIATGAGFGRRTAAAPPPSDQRPAPRTGTSADAARAVPPHRSGPHAGAPPGAPRAAPSSSSAPQAAQPTAAPQAAQPTAAPQAAQPAAVPRSGPSRPHEPQPTGPSTSFVPPPRGPSGPLPVPPPPPGASTPRRRRRWPLVVAAAAVITAVAAVVALLVVPGAPQQGGPGTVTAAPAGRAEPVPGRADVQVVDFGFTPVQIPTGGWVAGYGIRLRNPNPSGWVVTSVRLTVRFTGDDGAPLGEGQELRVGNVPPGADAAVPPDPPIRRAAGPTDPYGSPVYPTRPARMDIEIGEVGWGRAEDYAPGGIAAGPAVLKPRPDEPGQNGDRADVECRLTSTLTEDVHPLLVTVLLRDGAGAVVAAERSAQVTTAGGGATLIRLDPAGSQPMSVRLLSVPPAARTAECYPEYVQPLG